jgi:hypothetical protein
MVTVVGYTERARRRASKAGIELYRVLDSGNHPWKLTSIPVVCQVTYIAPPLNMAIKKAAKGFSWGNANIAEEPFRNLKGEPLGTLVQLIKQRWIEGSVPFKHSTFKTDLAPGPTFFLNEDGELREICIRLTMRTEIEQYMGDLRFRKYAGSLTRFAEPRF